jgi:hypothetical protein
MTFLKKSLLATAAGAAVLTLSAVSASAAIVCSGNVCWHSPERYDYPKSARIVIHDDDWKWKKHERYKWREHHGKGYWNDDHWVEFH